MEIYTASVGRFARFIFVVYFTVFILSIAFRLYVIRLTGTSIVFHHVSSFSREILIMEISGLA